MKKILTIMISLMIITSSLPVSVLASSAENESDIRLYHEEFVYDEDGSVRSVILDEQGREVEIDKTDNIRTASVTLPSSYDARDYDVVTSVKNQNPLGTCWAFAFCASAESSLISRGYATKDNIDLSEAHLAWFRGNGYVEGSDDPVQLDRRLFSSGDTFTVGGNSTEACSTVARWSGFALEEDYPYVNSSTTTDMNFPVSEMFVNNYNLESVIEYSKDDAESIKEAIMKNGALTTSYYSLTSNYVWSADGYCYYQSEKTSTNHAVTVVGWDDNFSASNFKTTPNGDGAWLIKNSWGTSHGNSGYFWLSYYDTSISTFTEVNAKPSGDYDNNYQYDGVASTGYVNFSTTKSYSGNIFTAKGDENVTAASFELFTQTPCKCTVKLYTGITGTSNPTKGTLRESKTINCSNNGFYTVDFDNSYPVAANEKFSIVVAIVAEQNGYAYIKTEYMASTQFEYSCERGQSFISSSGTSWTDCVDVSLNVNGTYQKIGNIPIKAFTVDVDKVTLDGIEITSLPKTEYFVGQELDLDGLSVSAVYSDGTREVLDPSEYTVSGFDSSTEGTKTLTVTYLDKTAEFNITVEPLAPITHIHESDGIEFITISDEQYESGVLTSGAYTFDEITVVGGLTIDGDVSICLCGEDISFYNCDLSVAEDSVLRIYDCAEESGSLCFDGGSLENNGRLEIYGAKISGTGSGCIVNEGVIALSGDVDISSESAGIIACKDSEIYLSSTVSMQSPVGLNIYHDLSLSESFVVVENWSEFMPESKVSECFTVNNPDHGLTVRDGKLIANHDRVIFGTSDTLCVVDEADMVIYGLDFGITSIDKYIVIADGYTYSCTSFGTGSELAVYKDDDKIGSYRLVIFGDVNGDGWADGRDATVVECMANGLLTEENVGFAAYMAADCTHDGVIDNEDTALLRMAGVFLGDVSQNRGEFLNSAEYEQYSELICQSAVCVCDSETKSDETEKVDIWFSLGFIGRLIMLIKFMLSVLR